MSSVCSSYCFFGGSTSGVMLICWHAANMSSMSSGEKRPKTVEQIALDVFQNCDVPEKVIGTFDPEVDLNDDTVGRSRHKRFYSVRSPIMRQKI